MAFPSNNRNDFSLSLSSSPFFSSLSLFLSFCFHLSPPRLSFTRSLSFINSLSLFFSFPLIDIIVVGYRFCCEQWLDKVLGEGLELGPSFCSLTLLAAECCRLVATHINSPRNPYTPCVSSAPFRWSNMRGKFPQERVFGESSSVVTA